MAKAIEVDKLLEAIRSEEGAEILDHSVVKFLQMKSLIEKIPACSVVQEELADELVMWGHP